MLLDCGLMFPDLDMLGIDLVLPDFTYLRENADRIVGCIATHGHEDHIGALSFLLRELSFPIYGSALTLGLARNRIEEAGLLDRTEFIPVEDGERRKHRPVRLSSSSRSPTRCPHGFATAFHTPQGVDPAHAATSRSTSRPVDGRLTDLGRIGAIAGAEGVRLLLSDSTNADEHGHSASETSVGSVLYDLFHAYEGRRIITTCFASHVHRVQQIADAAIAFDRTVATMGMSMKKNVRLAREMGLLKIPDHRLRDIDDIGDLDPAKVCIISTGSQGEPMSALALMAANENRWLKLSDNDIVIMSSHPIPGNEQDVSKVIDGLLRARRRGRALRHRRRARHRPRQGRGAQDSCCRSPGPSGSCPCTASTATSWPTPATAAPWASPPTTSWCARTATSSPSTTTGCAAAARCPPATSTSTGSSATSATACCATAGCWPTRVWWWSSSAST